MPHQIQETVLRTTYASLDEVEKAIQKARREAKQYSTEAFLDLETDYFDRWDSDKKAILEIYYYRNENSEERRERLAKNKESEERRERNEREQLEKLQKKYGNK